MNAVKKLACFAVILSVLLTGCGSRGVAVSYTAESETGEKIEIILDTSDGYEMENDGRFLVERDGEGLGSMKVVSEETYDERFDYASDSESCVMLDSGERDGNEYFMFHYKDKAYFYYERIGGSDSALQILCTASEKEAKKFFEHVTARAARETE